MGAARVEAFLEMMAAERGASPATLDGYGRDLGDFSAFLTARGKPVEGADATDVADHMADLAARGMAASTQARHLSAIRQFHRFLYGEGFRTDDPTGTVDAPKKRRPLPKVLSERDVDLLIETAALIAALAIDPGRAGPGAHGSRAGAAAAAPCAARDGLCDRAQSLRTGGVAGERGAR